MATRKLGDYRLIKQISIRGYDEEWIVKSVTGKFMLAEIIRRSRFEVPELYERAFTALRNYQPISHSHQNLETILYAGTSGSGDYCYYVTDLADDLGKSNKLQPRKYRPATLDSVLAHSGRLAIEDCINVALDIIAGLGYLHECGFVHRNVKPSRVRITQKTARVSGIWLITKIGTSEPAGTQSYIPPEGHGWPSGDLYSMGKTLERIAPTGETEFLGRGKLLDRWQSFLTKLCHPDPSLRYSTAATVRQELIEMRVLLQPNSESQFYSCFISYSHTEKAFALKLFEALRSRKIQCWLDEHQLLPGDDIHDRIDQGIQLWDKVLLCASKSSLTSWWVDGEINRAFLKEAQIMKERGKKVLALIPLNLDGFLFSDKYQSGKKAEIKSRIAANFVGWEKGQALFDRELEKVIRALKTDNAGREQPPSPKL